MAAVASPGTQDRTNLGIANELHHLRRATIIGTSEVAVAIEYILAHDDLEAESFERAAARNERLGIDGTRRSSNRDLRTGPNAAGSAQTGH
jgi:hypothetical protein